MIYPYSQILPLYNSLNVLVVYHFSILYNYCKLCEYWVSRIDTLKLSPKVRYSERFKELEPARHSLRNNNQSLGIGYIVNQANHNKKFVLSIIEFLKEIGWWCRMKMGKNISSKMNLEVTSILLAFKYTLCIMLLCRCHPLLL